MNKTRSFKAITAEDLAFFSQVLGQDAAVTAPDVLESYGKDWTEDLIFLPSVVLFPNDKNQISKILRYCNAQKIPVTPAGARTGLSGGMLPVYGGVVLATDRLNKIIKIDTQNLTATVQPGVINQHLNDATAPFGLMFPVDPSSRGSCFIGGNIAENAGGLQAVKYGTTVENVLRLEVVLANGEIIETGANVRKNATGYDLTKLLVGSEGTLGIITEATVKLVPKPKYSLTLFVPFSDIFQACNSVSALFCAGLEPAALELIERDAIIFGREYLNLPPLDLSKVEAHLLIAFHGSVLDELYHAAERATTVLTDFDCGEILLADSEHLQNELWRVRRCLGEAVKGTTIYKEEDTVVPRAALAGLVRHVKAVGNKFGFYSVCYGHAGDGNLHINIIKKNISEDIWNNSLPIAIREIFEYTVKAGGTISGEHGIGLVQKEYMDIAFSNTALDLMFGIKKLFDPNGILNPGKIFPSKYETD